MRGILFFFFGLFISGGAFAQCLYPVALQSTAGHCLGATLKVNTRHAIAKIEWYDDGNPIPVKKVNGTDSLDHTRVAIAGFDLVDPHCVFVDTGGNIYVTDDGSERIQMWTPGAAQAITVAGGNGPGAAANQFSGPSGVCVDNSGNIYVSDHDNGRVQKWARGASEGVTVAGGHGDGDGADQLRQPYGLYLDCDGNLFVADEGNHRVQKWAPGATSGVTVAGGNGEGNGAGQLDQPIGVWLDGSGNIYVSDLNNARVQKWAPGATAGITVAGGHGGGDHADQLDEPLGIYADFTGDLYVADEENHRVQKWAPGATEGVTVLGGSELQSNGQQPFLSSVTLDTRGNIYVADQTSETIMQFKRTVMIDTLFTPGIPGRYSAVVTDVSGYPIAPESTFILARGVKAVSSLQISASATNIDVCTPVTFAGVAKNNDEPASYQWQVSGVNVGGDSLVYSNTLFANGDRVVCIMTTDTGCPSATAIDTSNAIALSVNPQGHASVLITASDTAVCVGTPISFSAKATDGSVDPVFQWLVNGRSTGVSGAVFTSDSLTGSEVVYCLITSDASCGLGKSNSIPVQFFPPPRIAAGQVFSIPYGQTLELDPAISGEVAHYLWTPGTGLSDSTIRSPVANPRHSTVYALSVISPGGCAASGSITVNIYTPLSMPGGFTPNGDGRNDILYVLGGPAGSRIKEFSIFSRWGQQLFRVHDVNPGDPRGGWNGYANGRPAPGGTYAYLVVMTLADGRQQVYKGTVVLIR
jgi:gliding motility-associated-like protein